MTTADSRRIVDALSDEEVLLLICTELDRRLPGRLRGHLDAYVVALRGLPDGLRSMAATYQLDISLTLDDLGWHFGNWQHHDYSRATADGLRTLGPTRAAELFELAYTQALRHWDRLSQEDWMQWYHGSPLEEAVRPFDEEMRTLLGEGLVMAQWVRYARAHPDLLTE